MRPFCLTSVFLEGLFNASICEMQATTQTTFLELLGKLRDTKKTKLTILLIGKPQVPHCYSALGYIDMCFNLNICSAAPDT